MLLLRFDLDDIEKCNNVSDVFRMMGIGIKENDPQDLKFNNKEVFGEHAYYANLAMSDDTYHRIYDHLQNTGKKNKTRLGKELPSDEAFAWLNYSPLSNGPRFDAIKEAAGGEINDSVLYIITPGDSLYEHDPNLNKDGDDEDSSNS